MVSVSVILVLHIHITTFQSDKEEHNKNNNSEGIIIFDFEKFVGSAFNRISLMFGIEDDENKNIYTPRFKKVYYWFGYTGIPAFLSIVSVVLLFVIFFRLYGRLGFEKAVISLLLVIIVTLRGLKPNDKIRNI